MAQKKPIFAGTDDFVEIVRGNYYYIDKTLMIKELLDKPSKVTLFTRPRRFGKTINMTMLKAFFEDIPGNNDLSPLYTGKKSLLNYWVRMPM